MVKLDFTKFKPSQGKLLISEPFSQDPNFKRTVVLLATHNEEGSVGFVLNRSMELKLEQIIEDFNDISFPIWDGGPVQRDCLFYIHTLGDAIPESQSIVGDLYWGGNFETVKALIKGGKIGEGEMRMFIGYSGWSAGQLQDEIKSNCWLVTPATLDLVMNYPLSLGAGDKTGVDKFWRMAVKGMGKEYAALVNFPENPMWN